MVTLTFFTISYSLPSNSLIQYRLIVNGKAELDLMNPEVVEDLGYGNRNVFQMPDFEHSNALSYRAEINRQSNLKEDPQATECLVTEL